MVVAEIAGKPIAQHSTYDPLPALGSVIHVEHAPRVKRNLPM